MLGGDILSRNASINARSGSLRLKTALRPTVSQGYWWTWREATWG